MGDSESAAEGSFLGTWKFQEYKSTQDPIPTISLLEDVERFKNYLNNMNFIIHYVKTYFNFK